MTTRVIVHNRKVDMSAIPIQWIAATNGSLVGGSSLAVLFLFRWRIVCLTTSTLGAASILKLHFRLRENIGVSRDPHVECGEQNDAHDQVHHQATTDHNGEGSL
jgi:hypothetical protein